ncbi:MAG: hypothetical protein IKI58_09170, partial [Oscillospiraceae bacterium]|nr:hypothetical protein [Oscillospiraceae bacterium]
CDLSDWSDIVSIAVGSFHTIGIQADGRLVVKGDDRSGQPDVAGWTDIIAVAANSHSIGLKNDGTVVTAGSELDQRCVVSEWTKIGPRE